MVQSPFFWLALVVAVPIYWILPHRFRAIFLSAVSVGYLVTLDPVTAAVLAGWTVLFFAAAPLAQRETQRDKTRAARVVPFLLIGIFAYLGYHKYFPRILGAIGFAAETRTLLLPLGISYFTFKLAHYAIEVGRKNITDRSLASFVSYIFLFPIYSAGPIERYDHFLANRSERWEEDHLIAGATRIVHGLVKKFVIGEMLLRRLYFDLPNVDVVLTHLDRLGPLDAWRFLIVAYLLAYMDFSAYSDIAIGSSRLFGIRIMENFRWPILATNIGDFWKRWHMTLAGWCQAYVYMPMIGLTRKPYVAVFATFIAMGLWHAGTTTWVLWGVYHATGVSIYLTWLRIKRKRGWLKEASPLLTVVSVLATGLFVAGSFAFTVTHGRGDTVDGLRILTKLIGVNL